MNRDSKSKSLWKLWWINCLLCLCNFFIVDESTNREDWLSEKFTHGLDFPNVSSLILI